MNSTFFNALAGLGLGGLVIAGANSVPEAIRDIETRFRPVVVASEIIPISGDGFTAHVYGNKVRSCEYLDTKGYAVTENGISVEVRFEYVDDDTPASTRPKGEQDFGIWRWHINGLQNASAVYAIVEHRCGVIAPTRTKIGPFEVAP